MENRKIEMENVGDRWKLSCPTAKAGQFAFVSLEQGEEPIGIEIVCTHRRDDGSSRVHFAPFEAYANRTPDYDGPIWQWDGDEEKPSLSPSVLQDWGNSGRAHFIVAGGVMQLCTDHEVR